MLGSNPRFSISFFRVGERRSARTRHAALQRTKEGEAKGLSLRYVKEAPEDEPGVVGLGGGAVEDGKRGRGVACVCALLAGWVQIASCTASGVAETGRRGGER